MPIAKLLLLGVIIGSNNLAAGLALGTLGQADFRGRIVTIFGIFEFFIPLIGIWIGQRINQSLTQGTDWLGPLIIGVLGLWTVSSNFFEHQSTIKNITEEITTWSGLTILAASLSIDNLIIGFSLGLGGNRCIGNGQYHRNILGYFYFSRAKSGRIFRRTLA